MRGERGKMLWTQRMVRVRAREREVKVKLRNTANAFSGYGGSDLLGKIEISKPKYYCFYFFFLIVFFIISFLFTCPLKVKKG